jgi:hypothetical protein
VFIQEYTKGRRTRTRRDKKSEKRTKIMSGREEKNITQIMVFRFDVPYNLLLVYQHSGGTKCPHLQPLA